MADTPITTSRIDQALGDLIKQDKKEKRQAVKAKSVTKPKKTAVKQIQAKAQALAKRTSDVNKRRGVASTPRSSTPRLNSNAINRANKLRAAARQRPARRSLTSSTGGAPVANTRRLRLNRGLRQAQPRKTKPERITILLNQQRADTSQRRTSSIMAARGITVTTPGGGRVGRSVRVNNNNNNNQNNNRRPVQRSRLALGSTSAVSRLRAARGGGGRQQQQSVSRPQDDPFANFRSNRGRNNNNRNRNQNNNDNNNFNNNNNNRNRNNSNRNPNNNNRNPNNRNPNYNNNNNNNNNNNRNPNNNRNTNNRNRQNRNNDTFSNGGGRNQQGGYSSNKSSLNDIFRQRR